MRLNLAQMQAIQQCLEDVGNEFKNNPDVKPMKPVFEYKGHIMLADFYKHFVAAPFVENLDLDNIDRCATPYVVKREIINENENLSVYKANRYMQHRFYETVFKKPELTFDFLINAAKKMDGEALPIKHLLNIKCLDGSLDKNINFIEIDDDSKFDFISLISKN